MDNSVLEMHPLVRALVIVMLAAVPLLLVILPRLADIRKLMKQPKKDVVEKPDSLWPFSLGGGRNVSICPKCIRQNPPDNKFCGYCGSEIIQKKEN